MSYPANLAVGGVSKKRMASSFEEVVKPFSRGVIKQTSWLFFIAIKLRDGRESSGGESKI